MTPRSTTNSPPSLRASATSGPVPTERDAPRPGPRSIAAERAREALRRGWQAHLLGDRNGALFQLETLVRGLAGLGEDRQAVMLGLSLYAFTVASVGENEKAVEAANTVASIARRLDPARNTPWAVRNRLVSALPDEPMNLRLREGLQRWTLALAYRLPSATLRLVHERDLNRLRLTLQPDAGTVEPEPNRAS